MKQGFTTVPQLDRRRLAAIAALSSLSIAAPAIAADVFGSGAVITNRACGASGSACNVAASPRLQPHQYFGGYGLGLSAAPNNMLAGASGAAEVTFSEDYLPTVRVASQAGAETRTGASATAFRSFTYGGDVAIDFALSGLLHFYTSGDQLGPLGANEFTGDGMLNVALSLLRVPYVAQSFTPASSAIDIISNSSIGFAECGASGVIAAASFNSGGMSAGEYNQNIGLSEACGGGAIRINPGDSFVVVATLQAISNRTGFIDAMNTFHVVYDEQNTFFAGTQEAVGQGFLADNVQVGAAVPEPTTWALMIGGFGLAGGLLRRRCSLPT
ncbi:MAG: PEPxxWA-CTERM sorting domain-containing protein [Phenylobacterium sp.]|uniref:PEPxxWA-CTERM sorting domain-containing protein n=1 Tax=Phenylobacterium sp. TaxID=1871053 RepID=UPI001A436E56|nr:PEPxxWA-CTERM sorting domain-containing protein [Phenylobacterium sp.]MBL8773346.1 PEPxxWA-CTERM sorting domain-containing protein [Phenylobacterium sp.]